MPSPVCAKYLNFNPFEILCHVYICDIHTMFNLIHIYSIINITSFSKFISTEYLKVTGTQTHIGNTDRS